MKSCSLKIFQCQQSVYQTYAWILLILPSSHSIFTDKISCTSSVIISRKVVQCITFSCFATMGTLLFSMPGPFITSSRGSIWVCQWWTISPFPSQSPFPLSCLASQFSLSTVISTLNSKQEVPTLPSLLLNSISIAASNLTSKVSSLISWIVIMKIYIQEHVMWILLYRDNTKKDNRCRPDNYSRHKSPELSHVLPKNTLPAKTRNRQALH